MQRFPSADAPSGRRFTFPLWTMVPVHRSARMRLHNVLVLDCFHRPVIHFALSSSKMDVKRMLGRRFARPSLRTPTFTTIIPRRTWRAGKMFHSIQMRAPRPRVRSDVVLLDGTIHNSSQLDCSRRADCVCVYTPQVLQVWTPIVHCDCTVW